MSTQTQIKIKQGDGAAPRELAQSIIGGRELPFMATLSHKCFKPLVLPSTGIDQVIEPGATVEFKVKSFEQAWVIVTDSAALAKRYNSEDEDFVVIEVPAEHAVAPVIDAVQVVEPKTAGKGAAKAVAVAGE